LNRSFVSALLSLACLSTLPVLAQAGSTQPDVTLSVGANPTASGVSLSGTVQPPIPSSPTALAHPGGTLTFFDGSTALNAGGTALTGAGAFSSATFAQTFGTSDAVQAYPLATWQDVAGDFNGDGSPDLLIYSTNSISGTLLLQVFASIPDGKFVVLPKQAFPFSQNYPSSPTVLDVDGDGKLDLLLGNTVAYGKGDGTFSRVAVLPALATGFGETYAADVAGDGKLDIVEVDTPPSTRTPGTVQYMFTVFRNDGSGTFTSLGSFPLAPSFQNGSSIYNMLYDMYNIFSLSFADLNGDGKVDVLSLSNEVPQGNGSAPIQFNVMLNNGDGTFGAPKTIDTSVLRTLAGTAVAFGDLNGDQKNDLVVAYSDPEGSNSVAAALGNGDGTFGSFFQLKLINFETAGIPNPQVQLMDFNSDGKLDAILGSGELALGNGDGTFTLSTPLFPQLADPQTPLNYPLLQLPIYAHSSSSLVYLNLGSGSNAVFTPQDSSSASASVALSAGAHTLTAHYSGDSTYAAAVSPEVDITVAAER
jgi:FG-GAP-like repeat